MQVGEGVGDGQFLKLFQHLGPLLGQLTLLQDALQPQEQLLEAHRLENEVAGAFADGLLVGIVPAETSHHDDIGIVVDLDQVGELQAVDAGQHDVGDDHLDGVVFQDFQGILGAGHRKGFVAHHFDEFVHGVADGGVVVDDEDVGDHKR